MDGLENVLPRRHHDDGADTHGHRALVVTAVLTAIAATAVALRLWAKIGLLKLMISREDWLVLISLMFSVVYLAMVAEQARFGLGKHSWDLPPDVLKTQLQRLWLAIPFYNASMGFTKFSILFQLLRIFPTTSFRRVCFITMAVIATYTTWAVVSGFLNCVPVAKFWDPDIPGNCLPSKALWFFNASMNITTDLILLILPMPLLSRLQLPKRQKIALIGVFAIGILVIITSILRLSSLKTVSESPDTSYSNVGAAYWTAAECNVALTCACLPFIRPIISSIFPNLLSTNSQGYTSNRQTTIQSMGTGHRPRRGQTKVGSNDEENDDYNMYEISVKRNERTGSSSSTLHGIEVTTDLTTEVTEQSESASKTRLVAHP